ncbi:TetR/AcrR family transcriptional regulator [Dactylosporangium sp. CA-233914]|uniref:TetR/AcrR family transcriptional regulator n=1 Tax=Dactylosporangium sp. CA-233914 TaxID=3239934 RepID=UPI003D8BD467
MALRAEKKAATRTAIADAAMGLFLARGFDKVTVAEVGEVARVSVNTVFNYFATKEDLFFDRQDEVVVRLAGAVRAAPADPAAAALALFRDELDRGEPTLGLHPDAPAFWRVVGDSPSLQARARLRGEQAELALGDALAESGRAEDEARWIAAMLAGIDRALHGQIRRSMLAGESPDATRRAVRGTAERAFAAAGRALAAPPAEDRAASG